MTVRKAFFWMHLTAGCLAGIVILIMCVTGVLLAWKRQIVGFADRGFRGSPTQVRLAPEALLTKVSEVKPGGPTALTLRSDAASPVLVEFGRNASVYVDAGTGAVLGESSRTLRAFFRGAEDWHRWLATTGEARIKARGITGACNLAFFGLLLSGLYLWLPKKWNWQNLRAAVWFRRGKKGRARDWNWHNTIGIWCAGPLLFIVMTGAVMSYPWANNLVYRITGTEPPQEGSRAGGGRGGEQGRVSWEGLDRLFVKAQGQVPGWTSISIQLPRSAKAPMQFQIDSGDGGRPDLKGQLNLNRTTGEVVRWEPFSGNNAGRRLRGWVRFSHTGEAGGIAGETVAAISSLGGAFLVYTGLSLAVRRLIRHRAGSAGLSRVTKAASL